MSVDWPGIVWTAVFAAAFLALWWVTRFIPEHDDDVPAGHGWRGDDEGA